MDNISKIPEWLSDGMCRIATGAGFGTRMLHSDEDEVLFNACRPQVINGIGEIVSRGDLLDRSLLIELPAIPSNRRLPEDELWADFEACRPEILNYLLSAASAGLGNLAQTKLTGAPRMADFAKWITASEGQLGWPLGTFQRVYAKNQDAAHETTLDCSPIGRLIEATVPFDGTASDLLDNVSRAASESMRRMQNWPKTAKELSEALSRIEPALRATGIVVTRVREGKGRERKIHIRQQPIE